MKLFLIAQIGGRAVAIESSQVEAVVDLNSVVPAPRAERHVKGLAALRSRVVTVLDTHASLGLDTVDMPAGRAVITILDGHHYAILVDALEDVAPFDLAPLSSGIVLDKGWKRVGCGTVERYGEPILALNLSALIPNVPSLAA